MFCDSPKVDRQTFPLDMAFKMTVGPEKLALHETERAPGLGRDSRIERDRATNFALLAVAFVLCLGIMPLLYAAMPASSGRALPMTRDVGIHIALNCALNFLVAVSSIGLAGRLDRKIAAVLSRALMAHGALALFAMVFREYYSNRIILMALIVSCLAGLAFMYAKHRLHKTKIAIIASTAERGVTPGLAAEVLSDPLANLGAYDVILTPSVPNLSPEWALTVSRAMIMGRPVRHMAEYLEETQGLVCIDHFDLEHLPVGGLTSYMLRKRLLDIGLVVVALPVVLPILAVGCLVVLVTMGRPVFFVQSRIGIGGGRFSIYKLRTMHHSAAAIGAATSGNGDLRITGPGRWLRRFRIDELPQLWNVLKGDMSVIGPRPEWDVLGEAYQEQMPIYAYRHLVRPGITGWAQVRGGYASDLAETRTKVGYDLFYIKNLSFALDAQILARTVWTLLSGQGAR